MYCDSNQLNCLNLANGNNSNFNFIYANYNPNLTCVNVDNVAFSNTNWVSPNFLFDSIVGFSTSCSDLCNVSVDENGFENNFKLFPNPTNGNINISLNEISDIEVRIYNVVGEFVMSNHFFSTNNIQLKINEPPGLYFITIRDGKKILTEKILLK